MAAVSVFFIGTVVNSGVPLQGTITVKSTSQAGGASGAISASGAFNVKLNVAYGDTLTFVADWGQTATVTQTAAFSPAAGQAVPMFWDTATKVITGVGVQP